ncbi:hypothetical protein BC941DRAFT_430304 [Chlamydoabsidia padenii]|nr:hypothetical protein BC941DRAFT_430304 [Chlamydoabsidia padenii]
MTQSSLISHFAPSSSSSSSSSSTQPLTTNYTPNGSVARITFAMSEDTQDPTPPAPPPLDAKTFHPIDHQQVPTWIYPSNHPIRGYQFNIVRKALFSNTLVSIPTGLGKTFIAAVVMYNYYRWFPNSILIFMAPTRPLVEQQIKACFDVCGLPQKDTVMMVGTSTSKIKRPELWASGRVFFCTPQVVDNDLMNGICPAHKVAMVVIDEAHKATGNYSYTQVIERLGRVQSHFRVLALSATPGSTVDKVQAVVNHLRINTIEVRTEESMDVQEFSFGKRVQTVVIKLSYTTGATGIVPKTAESFCQMLLQPVLDRLHKYKAIFNPSPERCSPFTLLSDRKAYLINAKNVPPAVKRIVTVNFLLAESLARAYEGLTIYGVGTFVDTMERFLQGMRTTLEQGKNIPAENHKILGHTGLRTLLDQLRQQMESPGFVGHPKMDSLLNIILRHLNEAQEHNVASTRIIIFSSFRASVNMITQFLSQHRPMINCAPFIGQSGDSDGAKGMTQVEQQKTIDKFKKGDINVMVATCIGEEGLDIGEVDLIICYDSQNSSIRLLQRMGRTGRRRRGHCVMLMTEQEERKYKKATENYKFIQNMIAKRGTIECVKEIPTLLPTSYQPVVQRKRLVIGQYQTSLVQGKKRRRQESGFNKDGTLTDQGRDSFLTNFDGSTMDQVYDRFWPLYHPLKSSHKYLSMQQHVKSIKRVGHSRRTEHFVSLVKKIEQQINHRGLGLTEASQDDQVVLTLPTRRKLTMDGNLVLPQRRAVDKATSSHTKEPDEDDWSSFMEPLITRGVDDDDGYDHTMMDFDTPPPLDDYLPVIDNSVNDEQIQPQQEQPQQEQPQQEQDHQQEQQDDTMEDDDEFSSVDLDLLEQLPLDPSEHTTSAKEMFLFDDDLPSLPDPTIAPSNFTTTFAWANTKPSYSNQAKQLLIKRLEQNNKLCLSIRLLGNDQVMAPTRKESQSSWQISDGNVYSPQINVNIKQKQDDIPR